MDVDKKDQGLEVVGEIDVSYVADAPPVIATESRWLPYLGSGEGRITNGPLRGRARFSSFESELNGTNAATCIEDNAAACAFSIVVTVETEGGVTIHLDANGYAVRAGGPMWRTTLGVIGASEDERHAALLARPMMWLGTFDEERGSARATLYLADPERAQVSGSQVILRVQGLDCWAVQGLGCGSLIAPMLARIVDLAPDARSDHAGTLLRFTDRGQTESVRTRLGELGYTSELVTGAPHTQEWYAPEELSREEAHVLAEEITAAFFRGRDLASKRADQVKKRLEDALYSDFTTLDQPDTAHEHRASVITTATEDLLGADSATALGQFVERRLARR